VVVVVVVRRAAADVESRSGGWVVRSGGRQGEKEGWREGKGGMGTMMKDGQLMRDEQLLRNK